MTVWLCGDSIFRGAALDRFPDEYAAAEIEAEPLWPLRSPAAVMNLVLGEDLVRLGGVTGLPDTADKAALLLDRQLAAGEIGPADVIVFLDVGPHAQDPDQHERQWLALRTAAAGRHPVHLVMCGGFDDGARGRIDQMHDRPFGARSHNDAVRAAATAEGTFAGRTSFLDLAAPLAAFDRDIGGRFGGRAYQADGVHLTHWGQMRLCALILAAALPDRALDLGGLMGLVAERWRALGAASPEAAAGMAALSFHDPASRHGAGGQPVAQRRVLSYAEARRLKSRNPQGRWSHIAGEFAGDVWPRPQTSFRIQRGEAVFTIGSCFARNIEQHLVALGCRVPMMDLDIPPGEWSGERNGAMNKFHPPAFRQCLEWTAAIHDKGGVVTWEDCRPLAFDLGDGRVFDMDMACAPVARERFLERRQHIYEVFSRAFSADCLMMTPGLVEAWRDRTTGLYIHEAPTLKPMLADPERWELEILPYETCLADLLAAIDVVRARNPAVKVLVTTSPVPMSATFSGEDVRIANTYSKSVLRAACGAASFQRPAVDYFPSYECATLSFPPGVWNEDRIHVSSGFVGKIVSHMLDHYLDGVGDAERHHQQARTALNSGAFAEAEAAARAVLALWPEHMEARALLAEALLRLYRCEEAEAELKTLVAADPERADLWIMLARAIVRGDRTRTLDALAHVETAAALPSISLMDFRAVAALIRQHAPPDMADRLSQRAVELFPLHVQAYQLRADVLVAQSRLEDADLLTSQAVDRFPLHVQSHRLRADVLLKQARRQEAIEMLRHAVGLRRAPAGLMVQLAELLAESGEMAEAERWTGRALALEPGNKAASALAARLAGPLPTVAPAAAAGALSIWIALRRLGRPRTA